MVGIFCISAAYRTDFKKEEMVVISTKYGDMTVRLYPETPLHKANFLKLINESFYDSTLFHRVIKGFMIQGGDPGSRGATAGAALGTGGPGYTIPAEFNSSFIHKKGALSAARQGDAVNPNKESSGSQFYVVQGKPVPTTDLERMVAQKNRNAAGVSSVYSPEQIETYNTLGGTPHLDGDYTVFGEVVEGLEVIDAIANQPVDGRSRPIEDIVMSMKIVKKKWPLPTKK
ncbi:peptidylprolyl isomerase [Cryomorpha ignava]|uniref:Peptidyl-prolyl cis-trans isomerase n=2 Tax=Cryomorpha ignava TaxID=101383 RepID=A0A7K3WUV8_9FLAO|nr:peptidylprolyl isomerase [Cryomorpha ignava]